MRLRRPILVTIATGLLLVAGEGVCAETTIDFNRDVRPILSTHCFHCHGPDAESRAADLRLDLEEHAKSEELGTPAIVAGQPDESELVRRIETADDGERMPPSDAGKQLSAEEIATLREWIAAGGTYSEAWAYLKPVDAGRSPPGGDKWETHWIDTYVHETMRDSGMAPSPDADRITLIRRLSFDLTGLPPTPEEVRAFLADQSPDAYETLVDRLLASPRYGERMAMFWLDLVRYADTVGYHGDQNHHASPYRDWVINAFNNNMRFDDFTVAQLAGDFLPSDEEQNLIASGYNRLLQTNHEGGVQVKEYTAIYAADRVRNLSAVWMASTMGCCQCHDHKYDPLSTKEFYSLAAFFADIDDTHHLTYIVNREFTLRRPEITVLSDEEEAAIARLEKEADRIRQASKAKVLANTVSVESPQKRLAEIDAEVEKIMKSARRIMITKHTTPRVTRVLPRGNWMDDTGEIVEPAVPATFGQLEVEGRRATRLDLAKWLCDDSQGIGGLTARVMVNRFWALAFGKGLAPNLEDFGAQGEPPSHSKLLDALAVEFVESGWDIKHMMRTIVLSRTYRQASNVNGQMLEIDPYNRWLARQARFRLPAEMIRDNALSISGLIVHEIGGASIKPYQPEGHYRHLNFPKRKYHAHSDERQWRRGVYMHWQRQFLHPMLAAFDAPNREQCTAERPRSNTPLASLTLMNDPSFVEAARGLAARVLLIPANSDADRVDAAFELATSRQPEQDERDKLLDCLAECRQDFANHPANAKQLLGVGLAPVNESLETTELAAWTAVSRVLLNLSETNARN
ncbi:PSD1 and planctomycete cytochrome C domain-containing protein [Aeoliella sp. ICT_H6.2]|uniref:PSD1 and planctomycete cytochrome C domain-containing protein n=1 Tax=Aeoliella straminimaris TaxID=2954799 RepID=A0A9X2FIF4_9BACT|nr:PSD1 and planctomycete cytochrome C domain-containing protein [Aeoliella straminimaris]MCO6047076.1 PSD1 and planctomycete cytochrome C domain-containing protein [Aeoliella straminimaris]